MIELDNSECCLEQRVVQGEAVEIDDYSSPPTAASTSIMQLGVEIVEWHMNPRRKEGWSQILFGAFTNRGGGVSSDTTVEAEKVEVLHKLGRTRPYPQNPYLSIAINVVKGDWIPWHTDARNHGSTDLIFLGDFKGGVFSAVFLDEKMRERQIKMLERGRWIRFWGQFRHSVSATQGIEVQCSVLNTFSSARVLSRQHWKMLSSAGFPVKEFWKEHRPHLLLSAFSNECNSDDDECFGL